MNRRASPDRISLASSPMNQSDPKVTLRDFHEYVATPATTRPARSLSDIGVAQPTIWSWLANANRKPSHWRSFGDFWMPRRGGRLRATASGRLNPYRTKLSGPFRKCATLASVRSAEKRMENIQAASWKTFQGVCPKCGAMGPKCEGRHEALRAWNRRG